MTTTPKDAIPVETLSFEAAMDELDRVVGALEAGNVTLEESIRLYERGARLKAHCEARLKDAQLRVEKIVVGADGQAKGAEPAEFG